MKNPREMRGLELLTRTQTQTQTQALVHALGAEFETRFAVWSLEPAMDQGESPSFHSTIAEMTRDEKEALGIAIKGWIEKPGRWIWAGEREEGGGH